MPSAAEFLDQDTTETKPSAAAFLDAEEKPSDFKDLSAAPQAFDPSNPQHMRMPTPTPGVRPGEQLNPDAGASLEDTSSEWQRFRGGPIGRGLFGVTPDEKQRRESLGLGEQDPGLIPMALTAPSPFTPGPETAAGKALLAGFVGQFALHAPEAYKSFKKAWDKGDLKEAVNIATEFGFGAAFTALAGKDLAGEFRPSAERPRVTSGALQGPAAAGELLKTPRGAPAPPAAAPVGPETVSPAESLRRADEMTRAATLSGVESLPKAPRSTVPEGGEVEPITPQQINQHDEDPNGKSREEQNAILERRKSKVRSFVNSLPEGDYIIDQNGTKMGITVERNKRTGKVSASSTKAGTEFDLEGDLFWNRTTLSDGSTRWDHSTIEPVEKSAPAPAKEIATWDDAVADLQSRGKGQETKAQIQSMFPGLKLGNETAARLAKAAFGDEWKPGGQEPQKAPAATEKPSALSVEEFDKLLDDPNVPANNKHSISVGFGVKSVADLDRLAAIRNALEPKRKALLDKAQAEGLSPDEKLKALNAAMRPALVVQLPNEAIMTATGIGQWSPKESPELNKYGPRPLDWRTHPEVAQWLRENGPKLGLPLPEELTKPAEAAAAPAAPAAAPTAEPQWMGLPLSHWKELASKQLPPSAMRTRLAKSLSVADEPKAVAAKLKARIAEIEQSAKPNEAPAPAALAAVAAPAPPVVRDVAPGSIAPQDIRPSIRLVGGKVVPGKLGDTHGDIIDREKIDAKDIDQRGFSDPEGKKFFLDREAAAKGTGTETQFEPGGPRQAPRLHSTDLNRGEASHAKPIGQFTDAEWGLAHENAIDATDIHGKGGGARSSGRASYELQDAMDAFMAHARTQKEKTVGAALKEWGDTSDYGAGTLRKLRMSLQDAGLIESKPKTAKPAVEAAPAAAQTPEQEYDAALTESRAAAKAFRLAAEAYRARKIGDTEFLEAKSKFNASNSKFDAAETKFIEAKNQSAPAAAKAEAQVQKVAANLFPDLKGNVPPLGRVRLALEQEEANNLRLRDEIDATAPKSDDPIHDQVDASEKRLAKLRPLVLKMEGKAVQSLQEKARLESILAKQQAAKEKAALEAPPAAPDKGPGLVGLGGALEGEVATGSGEDIYGIAQRVREARALAGKEALAPIGQGISTPDSIERGRELIRNGANPEQSMRQFESNNRMSADDMAVARAHGEALQKSARGIESKFGTTSEEYLAAWKKLSDWGARVKKMQTEWNKTGMAQQGETDIDTGTFTGLQQAFHKATGKVFTPKQAKEAVGIAKGVKEAIEATETAKQKAIEEISKPPVAKPGKALETPAVPVKPTVEGIRNSLSTRKPGESFTHEQVSAFWKHVKDNYFDKGEDDLAVIRSKLAIEFGLSKKDVNELLASTKSARKVTDEMYAKMSKQRQLVNQAKNWLEEQKYPGWLNFVRKIPRVFFIDKVFGHGTVGLITHAGNMVFDPRAWSVYFPQWREMYKMVFSRAYHERAMQDLVRDPNYVKARRSGLANDPTRFSDDYQVPALTKFFSSMAGNRGFDALKTLRQARWNQVWNGLPGNLQTPEMASMISDSVNHATGIVRTRFPEAASWTFFAPKLEASRWAWAIGDPARAARIFTEWRTATPEQRKWAMSETMGKAAIAGTYLSLLAMNQGLLSASGSKQKVNYTDPRRGDFLSFKVDGYNLGVVGPMIGMVRLFANLLHAATGKRGKLESLTPRGSEIAETGGAYLRGKLSPFASFGYNIASQSDYQGRPLPFSRDVVPAYLRKQGLKRYSWGEYAAETLAPIPAEEAVKEVWRSQGMSEDEINRYLRALTIGGTMAATGARVSEDTRQGK